MSRTSPDAGLPPDSAPDDGTIPRPARKVAAPPDVRYRRSEPGFNQSWLIWNSALGARVLACGPAVAWRGQDGLGSGRTRDLKWSRHDETVLGSNKSDVAAAKGTQAGENRPRRRTGDPAFPANQGTFGRVGSSARADGLALVLQAYRDGLLGQYQAQPGSVAASTNVALPHPTAAGRTCAGWNG